MDSYAHVQRLFEGFANKPPASIIPAGFELVGNGGESFRLTPDCYIATPDSAGHHVGLNVGYGKLSNGRYGIQTFDEQGQYPGVAYFDSFAAARSAAIILVNRLKQLGNSFGSEEVDDLLKAAGVAEQK